jgi:NADH dehydrogenase FAD-containing subunit
MLNMNKNLVFAGGGHAHLTALKHLSYFIRSGYAVTLISPSIYHYYSGMGPGMLSGTYHPWEVRFHLQRMAERAGARFVLDEVDHFNPRERILFLKSGKKIGYDITSFNLGSEVPIETLGYSASGVVFPVKPLVNLLKVRQAILDAIRQGKTLRLAVIGGGPAGVEISANIRMLLNQNSGRGEVVLIGGKRLLAGGPERLHDIVHKAISGKGIEIIEGHHAEAIQQGSVILTNGQTIDFDIAVVAIGIHPSRVFKTSGVPVGNDGGMLVNAQLQSVAHPEIFGGGDCISLENQSLKKVGVYAVRQNPILLHNLLASINGGLMKIFKPQKDYLLILNIGNREGIFWKRNIVWRGRSAFLLKDYIDRRFMRTFQISGEMTERTEAVNEYP